MSLCLRYTTLKFINVKFRHSSTSKVFQFFDGMEAVPVKFYLGRYEFSVRNKSLNTVGITAVFFNFQPGNEI